MLVEGELGSAGAGSAGEPYGRSPRKLLVVAFHFPPDNSSTGVLRTLKFTQYLLDHGWQSEVLSVRESMYENRDPGLAQQIPPEVKVHRVWATDAKRVFGFRGRYPAFVEVPDRYWPWFFTARRAGRKLLAGGGFDALYSTSPHPTAHLIGLSLKRGSGLPWVIDFRDSWVDDLLGPVRRKVEGWLERRVVSAADAVVLNTPAMQRFYARNYADLPPSKFHLITNGYDESDFAGIELGRPSRFDVVYAGAINDQNRNPEPLLQALADIVRRGLVPLGDVQLTFLGCGAHGSSSAFARLLERYGLREATTIVPQRVPYREALRRQAAASLVVVLVDYLGGSRDWTVMQVPAKLYEYARLGNRTLVLAGGEAVSEFLVGVGWPAPIRATDTERVGQALCEAYREQRSELARTGGVAPAAIARYERRALTATLARILDGVQAPAR
jgi:glycosyltransferase involved in cell wall biosynthesis